MSDAWIFTLKIIGIVLVSYLIGNVNFADIISRKKHKDIRGEGSGNPGTMNMLRTFGVKTAVATLILDVLKGAIPAVAGYFVIQIGPMYGMQASLSAPVWLGYYTPGIGKLGMLIGGVAAILGHVFPVFKKFKGGKGVATALGAFLAIDPIVAICTFSMGLIYLLIGKYGCVSSFICIILSSAAEITFAAVFGDNPAVIVLVAFVAILIVSLHHENIRRLIDGTENDSNLLRRAKAHRAKKAAQGEPAIEPEATQTDSANASDADRVDPEEER